MKDMFYYSAYPNIKPIKAVYLESVELDESSAIYIKQRKIGQKKFLMIELIKYNSRLCKPLYVVVDYYDKNEQELVYEHYERLIEDAITKGFVQKACNDLEIN